jgi:hypothetical protein
MSRPYSGSSVPLASRMVSYYRDLLARHANDPGIGKCPQCGVPRCPDWCFAWTQLVCAGEQVTINGHERWSDLVGASATERLT